MNFYLNYKSYFGSFISNISMYFYNSVKRRLSFCSYNLIVKVVSYFPVTLSHEVLSFSEDLTNISAIIKI